MFFALGPFDACLGRVVVEKAVREGVDRRIGYRGPIVNSDIEELVGTAVGCYMRKLGHNLRGGGTGGGGKTLFEETTSMWSAPFQHIKGATFSPYFKVFFPLAHGS